MKNTPQTKVATETPNVSTDTPSIPDRHLHVTLNGGLEFDTCSVRIKGRKLVFMFPDISGKYKILASVVDHSEYDLFTGQVQSISVPSRHVLTICNV